MLIVVNVFFFNQNRYSSIKVFSFGHFHPEKAYNPYDLSKTMDYTSLFLFISPEHASLEIMRLKWITYVLSLSQVKNIRFPAYTTYAGPLVEFDLITFSKAASATVVTETIRHLFTKQPEDACYSFTFRERGESSQLDPLRLSRFKPNHSFSTK